MSRYSIQKLLQLSKKPHQYTEQQIEQMQMHISLQISTLPPETKEALAEHMVVAGNIVWLEPQHHHNSQILECILPQHKCVGTIEPRAFDHPAVILGKHHELAPNGETMVLCCTMSANPRPNANHPRSLPVSEMPKSKMADAYVAKGFMYLENGMPMSKQSNILNSHVYTIPLSQLTPYDEKRPFYHRLSKESYAYLMGSVGLPQHHWIDTPSSEPVQQKTLSVEQPYDATYSVSNACNPYNYNIHLVYYACNTIANFGYNSANFQPYPGYQYQYIHQQHGWTAPAYA